MDVKQYAVRAIPVLILFVVLLVAWPYFIRDQYLSMSTQTMEVPDLETPRKLHLHKHKGQGFIHGIDLEITGASDRTVLLMFGDCDSVLNQQVLLKKGKLDFSYTGDWYSDDCYIIIPSDPGAQAELIIDYRFLSSN